MRRIDALTESTRRGLIRWAWLCGIVAAVTIAASVATYAPRSDWGDPNVNWLIGTSVTLFVYLFGNLHWLPKMREVERAKQAVADLDSLARTRKRQAPRGTHSHDASRILSRREMDHAWYGDHSELDWRDRTLAQTLGLDVETYISNVKEAD